MWPAMKLAGCLLTFAALLLPGSSSGQPKPEKRAIYLWSHNDYERSRPLLDALEYNFNMVEADIYMVNSVLNVSHHISHFYPDTSTAPTLQSLYLEPLSALIAQHNGRVLPHSDLPIYLSLDVKTDAESTYTVLCEALAPYRSLLTRIEDGILKQGLINILISGNRPALTNATANRMVCIDGRISDIGKGYPANLYPVISDKWTNYFRWNGKGEIPTHEYEKLLSFVRNVHAEGKLIRFWSTQDNEAMWEVLLAAGVDIINVEDLERMHAFLRKAD